MFILKDFNDITTTLGGNGFGTLSLVYPTISYLIKKLQSQISDKFDEFIPPANSNDDNGVDESVDDAFMETESN